LYDFVETRARLYLDREGKISVAGGIRHPTPDDVPAPKPDEPEKKPTSPEAKPSATETKPAKSSP
jgi:hypothetical protein